MRRSIAVPLALLLACGGGETSEESATADTAPAPVPAADTAPALPPAVEGVELSLVGSIPWETQIASGEYRRVVVTIDGVSDTLADVAVRERPIVAGDSTVHGFDHAGGSIERGFVWRRSEGVATVDLPDDFTGYTASGLSPDGSHLAYAGLAPEADSGEKRFKTIVRTWPEMETVAESGPVAAYPSDAQNSSVEWLSDDSVEVRIRLDDLETEGGSWLRFRGSTSAGSFAADTVRGG